MVAFRRTTMFCYNCGQKINNSILKCPYCNCTFDQNKLDKVIFDMTIDTIAKECVAIPKPYNKTFCIADTDVVITDELYLFGYVNCLINKLQEQFKTDLKEYIHNNFLSKLVDEGENYLSNHFEKAIYVVLGYMKANGLSVTVKKFTDMKSYLGRIPFIWQPVYTIASEFDELSSLLEARRNAMDTPRKTTWVGGGFGIRGAIKGQIKAGIMNAGGSLLNSAGNAARRAIQSHRDFETVRQAKNEIMESSEFINAILSESDEFFDDLRKRLLQELSKDSEKSKDISRKIIGKESDDNYSMSKTKAIEALMKNPFDSAPYVSLYKHNRNNGAILSELAVFCGIENDVYYEFLWNVDNDIFEEKQLDLHSVGYDTPLDELLRINDVLVRLETNNPGFITNKDFLYAKNEQEYHQKVRELITTAKKGNAEQTIIDAFATHSKKEATKTLVELGDNLINNLLIKKFIEEVKEVGKDEFLKQFEGYFPLLVTEAVLAADYPEIMQMIS